MVEFYPTNSKNMQVFDVSGLLYTYTCITHGKNNAKASFVKGINVNGVKAVLEMVAKGKQNNIRCVLCLDSYCDKKRDSSVYKGNRVFHPEISVQSEIIESFFSDFGVDVLKRNGYEADDLIYSVVESNIDKFNSIEVITGDADIYGCMISPKVTIIGSNSLRPSFGVDDYPRCVKTGVVVPYNCILPYMVFFGKPSNNLNKLPVDGKNQYYLDKFREMLEDNEALAYGSRFEYFMKFMESGIVAEEHSDTVIERALLVYPRLVSIDIANKGPELNGNKMAQFLSFFRFTNTAGVYGLLRYLDSVGSNPAINSLMKRLSATVSTGTMMADRGLNASSFNSPRITLSNEFEVITDEW